MTEKLEGTTTTAEGDILIGSKDLTNFLRAFVKGYKFLNRNEEPRKIIIPRILFVDKVLIEYEVKDAKAK